MGRNVDLKAVDQTLVDTFRETRYNKKINQFPEGFYGTVFFGHR